MESESLEQRWRTLLSYLRPEAPPPDMALYVKPRRSCAEEVVRKLLADPEAYRKFLLVGAKGGGKSTELRAISQRLRSKMTLAEVDLDRSGVLAAAVSAYDLLYISALALLKRLPENEAQGLYDELSLRYAGGDTTARQGLGKLGEALAGIADFAGMATTAASAAALAPGMVPVIGAVTATMSKGLRLLSRPSEVVAETSPRGRSLQEIAEKIAQAVQAREQRPLCVLLDGLEKMNGEAGERFRQVFEQTRLLADTWWSAVIAAPPSTLTETSSVDGRGFSTKAVWGFGPDDLGSLVDVLAIRFRDAGFDPEKDVVAGGLEQMAERSGGLPRHAVMMAREAVTYAMDEGSPRLEPQHIEAGIREVGETLGRGLNEEHLRLLERVAQTGKLPGDEKAATLFADGRILAHPPVPPGMRPRFAVHPLLLADLEPREGGDAP